MRKTLLTALFAAALALPVIPATAAMAAPDPVGDYIVVLKDGTNATSFVNNSLAGSRAISVDNVYSHALSGYSAKMTAEAAAALAKDPLVQWVQPNKTVSTTAQTLPTGVNRVDAELSPTARINGVDERVNVDVAVIDTGIQLTHPDLNVYTPGAKNCNDGTSANDLNGHGTHVAGTIGALDNTSYVVGVAPGARLWPVRVLNASGSGTWAQVICGIDYVTANASQIEVANMSLGGFGTDDGNCGNNNNDAMHKSICAAVRAGVTFVVAAGNNGANAANFVPAAYDEVITVSALADYNGVPGGGAASTCSNYGADDTRATFSNFGADVDLIAPGVCILSTWPTNTTNTISGTSMASPHVAGGAALYKSTHPTATPAAVQTALQAAAVPILGIPEKLLNVATF
ncbi:S8 family serine peptidase [Sphaerisporangium sp. NPDC051011]|uniref:S8 family serine peptidase n=1 Tax=Sphaerisporangium sp. NPDC051011 TaxID=3155792 RepID=UPI0033C6F863